MSHIPEKRLKEIDEFVRFASREILEITRRLNDMRWERDTKKNMQRAAMRWGATLFLVFIVALCAGCAVGYFLMS